jgi:hypothetical protein
MWGKARGALWLRGKKIILLEGTQAMPARPSDKDRMGLKTLGLWVVEAWERDGRILFHDSLLSERERGALARIMLFKNSVRTSKRTHTSPLQRSTG